MHIIYVVGSKSLSIWSNPMPSQSTYVNLYYIIQQTEIMALK